MKIKWKTIRFRRIAATSDLLTTRLLLAALFVLASMLQLHAQNVVLTGAIVPGAYSVTASLKGFRDVQSLVRVLVGNTTSQDIQLQETSPNGLPRVLQFSARFTF